MILDFATFFLLGSATTLIIQYGNISLLLGVIISILASIIYIKIVDRRSIFYGIAKVTKEVLETEEFKDSIIGKAYQNPDKFFKIKVIVTDQEEEEEES